MSLSGASLPTVLKSLILTPITTFFTSTIPTAFAGLAGSIGTSLGFTGAAAVTAGGAIIIAAVAAVVAGIVAVVTHWDEIKTFLQRQSFLVERNGCSILRKDTRLVFWSLAKCDKIL